MTIRDIETGEFVTETEQVPICDYCGRDDRDALGDLIKYEACENLSPEGSAVDPDEYHDLHFHEQCIVAESENRGPMRHLDELNESHTWYAAHEADAAAIGFSLIALIVSIYVALVDMSPTISSRIVMLLMIGVLFTLIVKINASMRQRAETAIENVSWDWRQ